LLTPSTLDEDKLPAAMQFGRNYENKARVMFIISHIYHHRKCSYFVPGLMVSKSNAFLGASPDGVVKCSICGEFLVEIKCFFSQKNFHPKNALFVSKVCEKVDDNTLRMIPSHKYFYQIRGQLAVSGLEKCILVAYTQKGIYTVDMIFDKDFWDEAERRLYRKYMYSALKNIEETNINTDL
jgi:GR25 family glycosyltransferase involved in LPS biosynthesis